MRRKFLCVLMVMVLAFPAASFAGSLWDDNANWFADARPGRVGDIVTVLVNESTGAKDEANMDIKKESSYNVNGGNDGSGILRFIRGILFSTNNSTKGDGSVERK